MVFEAEDLRPGQHVALQLLQMTVVMLRPSGEFVMPGLTISLVVDNGDKDSVLLIETALPKLEQVGGVWQHSSSSFST